MKVLIVSEPGVDGVFRYVEALCHFLIGEGVEVHLAYSDRRGSDRLPVLVRFVAENGGETVNLRTGNRPGFSDLRAMRSLVQVARRVKPDVIHSHSSKAGALARLMPLFGITAKQIYHPHAYFGMRPSPVKLTPVYNLVEKMLGRKAQTVVCSHGERIFATNTLGLPTTRLTFIYNGVDIDRFSPASPEQKTQLRERLGLPVDKHILGFLGRSSEQKDPVTLYRSFAQAAKTCPELILFHVGQGELDPILEQIIDECGLRSRIFRRNYMSTPVDFYRAVDGFILTSRYEGFSIACLEAMACNLPLILSQADGNSDVLKLPLSHAWHATIEDVDGFSVAIRAWYGTTATTPVWPSHRAIITESFASRAKQQEVLNLYLSLTTQPDVSSRDRLTEVPTQTSQIH